MTQRLTQAQIKHMVDRFLGWKLPEDFHPDAGISFRPEFNVEYNAKHGLPPQRHEPSGTNLFNATQADAMVRHMLEGLPDRACTSPDCGCELDAASGRRNCEAIGALSARP